MDDGHVVLDTAAMVYDSAFAYFDDQCAQRRKERQGFDRSTQARQPKGVKDKQFKGAKRVAELRDYLENGFVDDRDKPIIRSVQQRQLHEVYIRTCLPKLYEDEWEDNQERILQQFGIDKLQQESLVVMPRRSGKTWSVAMFVAAMLIACRDIEVSVFATGQRIAGKLLKLVTKMLDRCLNYVGTDDFKKIQTNKECIVILGPDKTERTCGCYPGSVTVSVYFNRHFCVFVSRSVVVVGQSCPLFKGKLRPNNVVTVSPQQPPPLSPERRISRTAAIFARCARAA